ncbi:23318_t:CDS:2, partial [Entrophospora sp. SA101]
LPCNSGKKLEGLESDPLILHTVNSIVDLSRYRLNVIANNLAHLLETISKTTLPNASEENIPIDILQSQLFIIKILSACVINHWTFVRGTNHSSEPLVKQIQSETTQTHLDSKSNHNDHNFTNGHRVFILPKSFDDPPPLDDSLAKYILSVLSRFLRQMANLEDNTNSDRQTSIINAQDQASINLFANLNSSSSNIFEIITDIYRNAGHVIFYISASNWNVVFSRIKNRIGYLTSTNDERPETAELKFLECSDLNSKRLSIVIQ